MKPTEVEFAASDEATMAVSTRLLLARLRLVAGILRDAPRAGAGPWWVWRDENGDVKTRRIVDQGGAATGTMLIGRGRECAVRFGGPTISRRHCELEWRDGVFVLRDCGASAGTRVNSIPLTTERSLCDGDVVELGGALSLVFAHELLPEAHPSARGD